jgi:PAS domain S-box-containing protein
MLSTENKTKVLIVEHDQNDIDLLLHELKKANFNFEWQIAGDEKTFIKALKTFEPQLILSDYSMPGFGGVVAFEIKQKTAMLIPFIIVSGTIGEEKAVELIKRGVTDYALKDKLYSLIPKIKRALHEVRELEINHKTKEELLLSESTLRKAQEIAHIGSWRSDLAIGIGVWSEEKCRIFGLPPDANLQLTGTFLSFVHPDDLEFVKEEIRKSEVDFVDTSFYCRIITRDGTIKYIYTESRYELNKDGKPLTIFGIVQDITERKKEEKELVISNEELKKINSELDRFVYSVSHELRSPLTAMMGLSSLIRQETLEEENKELLNLINKTIFKMDETLREMLDHSRNARLIVKREKIEMLNIIEESFEKNIYFNNDFSFDKRIKADMETPFYSDSIRIKIIVNNLISNSLKYGKKDDAESYIKVTVVIDDDKMLLEIEDNGIGINAERFHDLFSMFYRATTVASGTGLGLYIAKECAEKMGGTIGVESEFGKGTKFTVEIPNNKIMEN